MSSSPKIFFMVRVGSFKMADVICQIGRLALENRTMAVLILYLLSSERQMTVFYWGSLSMYLLRHIYFFWFLQKHCRKASVNKTKKNRSVNKKDRRLHRYCIVSQPKGLLMLDNVNVFHCLLSTLSTGEFSNFFLAHQPPAICILH